MKHNPDDRSDNVQKIKRNINDTVENIELANDMIDVTSDEKTKQSLTEKNDRREKAITGMKKELKDEINANKCDC